MGSSCSVIVLVTDGAPPSQCGVEHYASDLWPAAASQSLICTLILPDNHADSPREMARKISPANL